MKESPPVVSLKTAHVINVLCNQIGPRPAGSPANQQAAEFLVREFTALGFAPTVLAYECPEWKCSRAQLSSLEHALPCVPNTYSPACNISGPVRMFDSVATLAAADLEGKIALLSGSLTAREFWPRNFTVFRDEESDRIVALLEEKRPLAVVMVSLRSEPIIPLLEDSEFLLPSVTVSADTAARITGGCGPLRLLIDSSTRPSLGQTIVARSNEPTAKRIVVSAHYDTKWHTPGAVDNASGVACLLGIAQLSAEHGWRNHLDLVVFGGEDSWYPGDFQYTTVPEFTSGRIAAAINIDGIGVSASPLTSAFFNVPEAQRDKAASALANVTEHEVVDPWYSGDHSLFWPNGIPTVALCSKAAFSLVDTVIHTERDVPDLLDPALIASTAFGVAEVVRQMADSPLTH